jgi:hypothetical protein
VAYEIPRAALAAHPNCHPKKLINYAFNIRLATADPEKAVESHSDTEEDGFDGGDDSDLNGAGQSPINLGGGIKHQASNLSDQGGKHSSSSAAIRTDSHGAHEGEYEDEDMDDDEGDEEGDDVGDINFDNRDDDENPSDGKKHSNSLAKSRFLPTSKGEGGTTVGSWFRRRIDDITPDALDVPETTELVAQDFDFEAYGDLRYCAMSIETNDHRLMGRRRTLYLVPWPDSAVSSTISPVSPTSHSNHASLVARIRAFSEIAKAIPMVPIPRMFKNKKLSSEERKRRQIAESYKALVAKSSAQQLALANACFGQQNEFDKTFLDNSQTTLKLRGKSGDKYEGGAAMATAPRSWSEQFIKLSKSELAIYKGHEAARPSHVIPAQSIFCVRPMKVEETPLHLLTSHGSSFAFFQLETFARVFYFMVREKQLIDWLNAFEKILGGNGSIVHFSNVTDSLQPPEIVAGSDEAYVAKPTTWRLDKRRIFNYRRIIFNYLGLPASVREKTPNELVEDMLSNAFALAAAEANNSAAPRQWIAFLDKITVLQVLDFSKLQDAEKAAFLLNLYHLMVLHGSLIIGPPPSWASWQAFFNTSYLLLFDIVSIAEIEHNMLRACMSRPSPLLSKIRAPNSQFPALALQHRDFRLNFCINNGSRSMPESVPIYRGETLNRQMDDVSTHVIFSYVADLLILT